MVKKIIAVSAIALLAFSGCSAKKEELVKPQVKEAVKVAEKVEQVKKEAKAEVSKKVTQKLSGVASVVPASEFFK